MPSYVRPGIRKCAKNRALSVPGLRDQGLSRNTIAMGYGMPKHSVINVFDAADRLGVSYGGVEDKNR